ncbi:hypothetical protein PABG_12131 [Paracoccidioides brasiliensis Pb03]|nr:hypothetical protein PABG_12131 [Paracoccidioides brasiliensis Pb03]
MERNPNAESSFFSFPLAGAAFTCRGSTEVVDLLLENSSNVHHTSADIFVGHWDVAKLLLKHGATPATDPPKHNRFGGNSADRGHRNGEGKAGIRQLPSEWDVISKRSGC